MTEPLDPTPEPLGLPGAAAFPTVPDHELVRLIGSGSSGQVWLARNVMGTFRAVKIVYERSFRHRRPYDREFNGVQKFEPISRLHDGLVDVLQVGRNDAAGHFYCIMELADDAVSGQTIDPERYIPRTLAQEMSTRKRLPVRECLNLGSGIAAALSFLHKGGLIHRDIKPSNIIFVNGVPKLADIGLVADVSEARSYVGTEGFIPPEGPGTVQADLYSLGKVLYEISTGKDRNDYPELPEQLGDVVEQMDLIALNKIVVKACRVDLHERYKTADEMLKALLVFQFGEPPPPPDRGREVRKWISIGGLAVGLFVLSALVLRLLSLLTHGR